MNLMDIRKIILTLGIASVMSIPVGQRLPNMPTSPLIRRVATTIVILGLTRLPRHRLRLRQAMSRFISSITGVMEADGISATSCLTVRMKFLIRRVRQANSPHSERRLIRL